MVEFVGGKEEGSNNLERFWNLRCFASRGGFWLEFGEGRWTMN